MSDPTIEEDGLISQDDIDKLLQSSSDDPSEEKAADDDGSMDELGELSQNDIDRLMNPDGSPPEEDNDFEELSEDDIKALLGTQMSKPEKKTHPDDLKDDISEADRFEESLVNPDPYLIDESDAVPAADCLVAQETIDQLIGDPDEDFLKPRSNGVAPADVILLDADDDKVDVSQEDIDALLMESEDEDDEDDEGEDDILISQDDIDTLLMAADQEDEDVLGDLMDKAPVIQLEDESGEETLGKRILDEIDEDDGSSDADGRDDADESRVVLRKEDETAETSRGKRKRWIPACISALVILGITVPAAYFLFFSSGQKMAVQMDSAQELTPAPQREIEITILEPDVKSVRPAIHPGNMVLKDFIILTPDVLKGVTYFLADISIDYADQNTYHEIQNNLPFFRDLIYSAINKSFLLDQWDQITEPRILSIIETALKNALPEDSIHRVIFLSFIIS